MMGGRHRGGGATAVDVSGADEEPQADMTAAEVSSLKHRCVNVQCSAGSMFSWACIGSVAGATLLCLQLTGD